MAGDIYLVSQFVAAGAMFLLAGGLLYLNFQSRVNRAFALFLFFRGMVIVANRMKGLAEDLGDASGESFWLSVREYYNLALAPSLLYFLVVYARPSANAALRWSIVAVGAAVEIAYAGNHCLDLCLTSDGRTHLGPLALLGIYIYPLMAGIVGLWLAWDAASGRDQPRERASLVVASAFILIAFLEAALALFVWIEGIRSDFSSFSTPAWGLTAGLLSVGGLVPAVLAILHLAIQARTKTWLAPKVPVLASACLAAVASSIYVGLHADRGSNWLPGIFIFGLWRILLPAMVAYALVRHRLFGLDVHVKWTLNRGFIAAIFLAVFFVVAQVAQNLLNNSFGWAIGGVAAGILMFGLTPLQRMAERFSQAVMPHTKPVSEMAHPERLELFRQQAFLVWSDGTMGPKERSILDQLRDRLGVSYEAAARIEREASRAAPRPVRGSPSRVPA